MVRRARKSLWAASFQRSVGALTRAGTRAVVKATKQALKASAQKLPRTAAAAPRPAKRADRWHSGIAVTTSGARRYRLYKPPGASKSAPAPLFVLLHGCDQDAVAIACSSRIHGLAVREGVVVLCPEQDRLANPQSCWNWFETRSGRALAEAALIMAAIDQACALHGADPTRVAVAGLSAGASMAALLALRYPERFKAVAMHSGIAPGAAHSTATAMAAMQGRRAPGPLPADTAALPPLLVIHGSADHIVNVRNGRAAAQLWADAGGATPGAPRMVQRGARYAATVTDFKKGPRLVATLCEVAGLGHAWSGGAAGQPYSDAKGPDAARMIWAFASRCWRQSAAKQ